MSEIHPSAVVAPEAQLDDNVVIGPYCLVGPHVRIGAGTVLMSHVVVDGHTAVGAGCRLFPFACIGMQTQDLKFEGGTTYAEVGDRTTLREYVTINTGTREGEVTRVGSGCLLMAYCHVAHGCRIEDSVIMSNATQLAGEVVIESFAILSGVVAVHQFVRIGTMAMIGGLSKIQQDCPPFMMTDGNPAEVRGINSIGLQRRGVTSETRQALKQAYRMLHREGLATTRAISRIRETLPNLPEIDHLLAFYESSNRGVTR